MNSYLIENNYDLKVSDISLLDKHFGTEIYVVDTDTKKYIVKVLPLYFENIDNEGFVTEYLHSHGHKVARLLKMWFNICHPNTDMKHFKCSNYKSNRGTCEGTHYIRADSLETVVLMELKRLTELLKDDEDSFAELLESKTNSSIAAQQKAVQEALHKATIRGKEAERLYEGLYENMVNGKVTEQWYMHMSQKYEVEREELQTKIKQYRMELLSLEDIRHEKDHFLSAIRSFMNMQTLTPVRLRELIEKIEVHNIEGTGKNRTQRITIHYRFIGTIEIPAAPKHKHFKLDTRQGVAAEYLPNTATA